jgi:3-hydroxyisobutyrate dehydrogenase
MDEHRHPPNQVGFIGLGAMGAAVAARLVPHVQLSVADLRQSAVDAMVAKGARAATQLEIARTCAIVFVSLPRSEDVRDVIGGGDGLAATMTPGSVVIDMTTGNPAFDEQFVAELAPRDIGYADAPVSGGPQAAAAGSLAILLGASEETKTKILPTLELISSQVLQVGEVGAGHVLKLVNNLLSACNRLSALEAIAIAVRSGVNVKSCVEALNKSSGRSYITESTYPKFLLGDEPLPQDFKLSLMLKDVGLAVDLGERLGLQTRMGSLTRELISAGVAALGDHADINELMKISDR